jgi:hypothetical protein
VATERFEMLRLGVQEAEARIAIERALTDPASKAKLGEAPAARCQAVLDERSRCNRWAHNGGYTDKGQCLTRGLGYGWYAQSGWQERSKKLFDAAAEASAALGGRK